VKGKPPLKNMGSSSSCEGASSGFISRDSSSEQFVDQNGIDLVQFFKETLNKNAKDRNMLMKIERDLIQLAVDQT
jgi:a component of the cytoplasm (encore)